MTDDREMQIVEIPIVLHEQRASLPFDLKIPLTLVHTDEFYPMKGMNGMEICQSGHIAGNSFTCEMRLCAIPPRLR